MNFMNKEINSILDYIDTIDNGVGTVEFKSIDLKIDYDIWIDDFERTTLEVKVYFPHEYGNAGGLITAEMGEYDQVMKTMRELFHIDRNDFNT